MKIAHFSGELNSQYVKDVLKANLSLFGILFGLILLSVATGQFSNYDSQLEYNAALGVVEWGLPYFEFGNFINQPPLGFYIGALFLRCLGSSYAVGVTVATLFGVGCIFLLYKIGRILYENQTGLFAAAIFALTPWHVVLSRSFLIDIQCLFFSLLTCWWPSWQQRRIRRSSFYCQGFFSVLLS
jgi:4-amino-4-deoxy-L-arabinose transferase-like glycosyltransferase